MRPSCLPCILLVGLLGWQSLACATQVKFVEIPCPVGGEPVMVKYLIGMPRPSQFDKLPRSYQSCPGNGFILFRDPPTWSRYSAAEIALLTPYVESAEFQALRKGHDEHYLVARLLRVIGAPETAVGVSILEAARKIANYIRDDSPASYFNRTVTRDPEFLSRRMQQLREYLEEAHAVFSSALAKAAPASRAALGISLTLLDIERRLGRFEAAGQRILAIDGHPVLGAGKSREQLDQQRALLAERRDGTLIWTHSGSFLMGDEPPDREKKPAEPAEKNLQLV